MTHKPTLEQAQAAKQKARSVFSALAGEVAVGITPLSDGGYGLKVNLVKAAAPGTDFPTQIDGVPCQIDVTGRITKY